MRVILRHLQFDIPYSDDIQRHVPAEQCRAFVTDDDLPAWLEHNRIRVYGEAYNEGRGSNLVVYADMDPTQYMYYYLRWGSPLTEQVHT